MMGRGKAAGTVVAALLAATASPAMPPGAVAAEVDVFPTVEQVAKLFPDVDDRTGDGYDGWSALFPGCAVRTSPDRPDTTVYRTVGYLLDEAAPKNTPAPSLVFYSYKTERKAKRVMAQLGKYLKACRGLTDNVDEFSKFTEYRAEDIGDDGISMRHKHWWDFEDGPFPIERIVWVRDGKRVMETTVYRNKGKVSRALAVKTARLFLREAD